MSSTEETESNKQAQAKHLEDVQQGEHFEQQGWKATTNEEAKLDRRINIKTDCIVVLVLTAGFMFQAVDKANISNAATTKTFTEDLQLKTNDVSNAVSLYAATFIPSMPISVIIGRLVGPRWWIPAIIFAWGIVTITQAVMETRQQLIALRLLLGVCEAGYIPTAYYFIGTLYPTYQAGFRMGLMATSFAFSGAFAGMVAYGCFHQHSSKWKDWQILFLVQGSVSIFVAALALVLLPKSLGTAWFLTREERAHAVRRMVLDTAMDENTAHANSEENDHRVTVAKVLEALKDWKKVLIVVFNICATTPAYGFAIFLPLIVKGMGYDSLKANIMTVPPFMVGAIGQLSIVWFSDRLHDRSGFVILSMFISIIGYIALIASENDQVRYGFLHIALIGSGAANPLIAAWLTDNTPEKETRAITMGFFGITNLAAVIAGQVFRTSYAPSYRTSIVITMVIVIVGMFGFAGIRVLYAVENKRRREEVQNWTTEQFESEKQDTSRLGHNKRYFVFRY